MGLLRGRGRGRRRKKIGEDGGEEEEEKSLTGDTSKALITAYFLVLSGKIKICGEENLVLQEHIVFSLFFSKIIFQSAFKISIRVF